MNLTLAFSGPPFATLPVSYSWHRNNPASLCWWELSGIFVGALWGSILYGVMFRNWLEYVDLQRVHRFPYCCKLSESLTQIDIKCQSAKSPPWCEAQPPWSLPTVDWVANQFAASMVVASHMNYCPGKARRLVSYQLLWGEDQIAEPWFCNPANPYRTWF